MIGLNEGFGKPPARIPPVVDLSYDLFADSGLLVRTLGLEHRPQQSRMAECVAEAFAESQSLLFEAGTGVGKSLAYLIPGLIHAIETERPLLVSSHTIALQEQIQNKDLELCRGLFRADPSLEKYKDFKHALLVGKSNYLCGSRLRQALSTRTELFPSSEQKELERIANWAEQTKTGLISELDPIPSHDVWEWVHADGSACNNRNCNTHSCFYRKARAALRKAQVIIVNHSLLMALLASGHSPGRKQPGVLFPNDFLVVDEAHRLPAIAAEHFGLRISSYGLRRQLMRLYQSKRKKARGLLHRYGTIAQCRLVDTALEASRQFFTRIHENLLSKNGCVRVREEGWILNDLDEPLSELANGISKCEYRLEEGPARDELKGLRASILGYRDGLREALDLGNPEAVYWVERTGRRESTIHVRSAPIDVAPILRQHLFERDTGVVLTSATLAEGRDMDSFKRKVGAFTEHAYQEHSPFDYERNLQIFIASDAPVLQPGNQRLDKAFLIDSIRFCVEQVKGGTLVLFTSYQDLNAVATELRPQLETSDRSLLCQGQDGPRSQLVERMRSEANAVLLGTDSFWTGVDIAGPALSQVIITRLPFANPSHPITEARHELCRERGGQPFFELTLPEALIPFRQGLGRLIRSKTDSGNLVILDSRILHKTYGKAFLETLPHSNWKAFRKENRQQVFLP